VPGSFGQHGWAAEPKQNRLDRPAFRELPAIQEFLVWACVATAVATMIIGFSWGGWVTGGTSRAAARRGEFSLGPMLMALMRANKSAGSKAG